MDGRTPLTARSRRTRAALRRAAMARFLDAGVEETAVEDIAADAGVTVRTFYRHFASKHDLLFADYDAGLVWFRRALSARPDDEPIIEGVQASIMAFPYDVDAIADLAALRAQHIEVGRIAGHLRRVEADFAAAIETHLRRRVPAEIADPTTLLPVLVAARTIAAATFAAMELWISGSDRSMGTLAVLCHQALDGLARGLPEAAGPGFVNLDERRRVMPA